mmetsp:Transcript_6129/g.10910  ORF Transcript_6129/g.10910 Transcript_6129/m.10910 type:complete len:112 (-) Transcript_6129:750-1085(-)
MYNGFCLEFESDGILYDSSRLMTFREGMYECLKENCKNGGQCSAFFMGMDFVDNWGDGNAEMMELLSQFLSCNDYMKHFQVYSIGDSQAIQGFMLALHSQFHYIILLYLPC